MMENDNVKKQAMQRRKVLLVLPVPVILILTVGFWGMGGGKESQTATAKPTGGYNMHLPEATGFGQGQEDKLAMYEKARKDSLRRREAAKQDPYFMTFGSGDDTAGELYPYQPLEAAGGYPDGPGYTDPNEQKVYAKLAELHDALDASQSPAESASLDPAAGYPDPEVVGLREDISRLEQLMATLQSGGDHADPEMDQINAVLDQVLDIQHPERVAERLRQQSAENTGQVFQVSATEPITPITLLENRPVADYAAEFRDNPTPANGFHGLGGGLALPESSNAIEAVVHETQTLVSGATVKLRLLNGVYINGRYIPKDHFVYGQASLNGERLQIEIKQIRYKDALFPVKLSVHDLDGLPGIHIPGAITRDVAKQTGEQAIQSMNLGMYSPSLEMQAASTGIELGRNLLSRKLKLVKVEVKAGYRVLLRDGQRKSDL